MTSRIVVVALMCIGASGMAIAQNAPPPDASSQPTPNETPAPGTSTSRPASASSPHQRQALGKQTHDEMMKDCIAKARTQNSNLSTSDAKKACKEQMKSESKNR